MFDSVDFECTSYYYTRAATAANYYDACVIVSVQFYLYNNIVITLNDFRARTSVGQRRFVIDAAGHLYAGIDRRAISYLCYLICRIRTEQ